MEMKRILGLRLNLGNSLGLLLWVKEGKWRVYLGLCK